MEYFKIAKALMQSDTAPLLTQGKSPAPVVWENCPANITQPLSDADWQALADTLPAGWNSDTPTQLTCYAFMQLVGDTNMVAILTSAKTDIIVELMVEKMKSADVIDFADATGGPRQGLQYLVSQEIITQAEYDRIIAREFLK